MITVGHRLAPEVFLAPQVTIQHNAFIGNHVEICCGANIAGNVQIADDAIIYVGVNIANRVKIGKGAVIGMGSNVIKDVPAGETHFGNPARKQEEKKMTENYTWGGV